METMVTTGACQMAKSEHNTPAVKRRRRKKKTLCIKVSNTKKENPEKCGKNQNSCKKTKNKIKSVKCSKKAICTNCCTCCRVFFLYWQEAGKLLCCYLKNNPDEETRVHELFSQLMYMTRCVAADLCRMLCRIIRCMMTNRK